MRSNSFFQKTYLLIAASSMMILIFFSETASAGWHQWSQITRNQAIVDETANWYSGEYGGQCKLWVQQDVVPNASGISNLIPATSSNVCYWNYGAYVVGRTTYIENANMGEIVQMKLSSDYGSGPHTFIITATSVNGFVVAESNWCENDCELVGFRYIDYDDFYDQVDCFTVYYVL